MAKRQPRAELPGEGDLNSGTALTVQGLSVHHLTLAVLQQHWLFTGDTAIDEMEY